MNELTGKRKKKMKKGKIINNKEKEKKNRKMNN